MDLSQKRLKYVLISDKIFYFFFNSCELEIVYKTKISCCKMKKSKKRESMKGFSLLKLKEKYRIKSEIK